MSVTMSNFVDRDAVPAGYREVLCWRLGDTRRRVIAVNLLVLLSLVPWLFVFRWLATKVGGMTDFWELRTPFYLILAGIALTLVLHELVHGLAAIAFGSRVQFGALLTQLMFYCTAPGHVFERSAFLVVALAPLVGLSLLALLGMILLTGTPWVGLLAICAAGNAAMAGGDLWITSVVLRYPSSARLIDERDGVRILLPAQADSRG